MAGVVGVSALLNAYNVASLLVLLSFVYARQLLIDKGDLSHSQWKSFEEMSQWETQTLKICGVALLIKLLRRGGSAADMVGELLWYCRVAALGLGYILDWRLALFCGLAFLVVYLLVPQPTYQGPENVMELTPGSFKVLVEDAPEGSPPWLVEYYSPWAGGHAQLQPILAKLSIEYGAPEQERQQQQQRPVVRFGRIDLGQWGSAAADRQVPMHSLPVLVLYKPGAKEVCRLPDIVEDTWLPLPRIRREDVLERFDLEGIAAAAERAAAPSKPSRAAAKRK